MPPPLLPAVKTPRLCYPFQLLLNGPAPSNGGGVRPTLYGPSTSQWSWPMPCPESRWFIITNIHFASKYGAIGRSSYFVLTGLITITDVTQSWSCGHPSQGLIVPPGGVLDGFFLNNEMTNEFGNLNGEEMNMNAVVRGFQVDNQIGMSWYTVLHGIDFNNFAHPGEVMAG